MPRAYTPVVPLSTYERGLPKRAGMLMPTRFRLYPNGKGTGLYLVVQVWPSLKSLRQYVTTTYPSTVSYRRTLGMCSAFDVVAFPKGKPQRKRGIFAELNLCAANLTMRIVTHELFHATMAYARRAKIDLAACMLDWEGTDVAAPEEALADVHGQLCSDFVWRATALGLYDDGNTSKVVARAA
jgi:hypothetical protein